MITCVAAAACDRRCKMLVMIGNLMQRLWKLYAMLEAKYSSKW